MDFSPFCKRLKMTNFPKFNPKKIPLKTPTKPKPQANPKKQKFPSHPKNKIPPKPAKTPKKPTPSLRASKASVAIHKFKAYLKFFGYFATLKMTKSPKFSPPKPQKTSQKPPPSLRASHKASVAIHKPLQKQKSPKKIQPAKAKNKTQATAPSTSQKFFVCHTELSQESEVSINLKCKFTFENMDFSS